MLRNTAPLGAFGLLIATVLLPLQHPAPAAPGSPVAVVAQEKKPDGRKQRRAVVAVLSVGTLAANGRINTTSLGQKGDAIMLTKAEEAITKSRAYRLVGRDMWESRVKEIKFNEEGYVDEASAKKFGGDVGVDKLLVVFVSGGSRRNFTDYVDYERKKRGRFMECTIEISCRYTDVSTGARQALSYSGSDTALLSESNAEQIAQKALNKTFAAMQDDLWNKRQPYIGKIVQAKPEFIRIDLGEQDGIEKGMLFELYTVKDEGDGFFDRKRFGGENVLGRVIEVNETNAKLELGEMKDKKMLGVKTGSKWEGRPSQMKALADSRVGEGEKTVIEAVEKK